MKKPLFKFKTKKKVAKEVIIKTKKPIIKHVDKTITENLKKKVFPYIINDIINACHTAKIGESIRIGKLGRLKKARRQGTVNGISYNTITYSFKAFSLLKNN